VAIGREFRIIKKFVLTLYCAFLCVIFLLPHIAIFYGDGYLEREKWRLTQHSPEFDWEVRLRPWLKIYFFGIFPKTAGNNFRTDISNSAEKKKNFTHSPLFCIKFPPPRNSHFYQQKQYVATNKLYHD